MRVWSVSFDAVSVTVAQDFFDIAPATDKPVKLLGFSVANVGGTADAGDGQEELLSLQIIRGLATVGSGGSSATAVPVDGVHTDTSGFTARVNDTTVAVVGAGRTDPLFKDGFNVRVPYVQMFTPETYLACTAASGQTRLVIRLNTAPNDAILLSGTAWVGEGI